MGYDTQNEATNITKIEEKIIVWTSEKAKWKTEKIFKN